jgi:YidC/Oxa1 family membrane protein insertase
VDTRRILFALALSVAFFALYDQLVLRRYARPRPPAPPSAPELPAAEPVPPATQANAYAAPAEDARVITVDTEAFRVSITEAGARIVSLELKAYRRAVGADSGPLDIVVRQDVLPATVDLGKGFTDAAIRYRADRQTLTVGGADRGEVLFTGEAPGGMRLRKRFVFDGNGYVFRVALAVEGGGGPTSAGLLLTPIPDHLKQEMAVGLQGRSLVEHAVSTLESKPADISGVRWAGFSTPYFLAVAIPPADGVAHLGAVGGTPAVLMQSPLDGSGATTFELYAGPKDRAVLQAAGHDLVAAVNYGMFWFVAVPLLGALRLLHRVTSNYGIDIIILTVLVKMGTIPLTRATFKNMKEMQRIQPQMAKIRERYKDDPQTMQQQIMELYKRHQVNPFAGCLPMVLQMPILMGFYSALMHAIELRQAPFALWIDDLSSPDRLMVMGIGIPVLTLLMGASMVLQTWLQPAQGDPMQQRMMMFMPLVFTFMFINMPAGLVLYWLVNNVLSIAQQYWMMRAEPRPTG